MNDDDLEYDVGDFGEDGEELSPSSEESGAIAEVETGDRIHFMLNPESFEDSKDTEFAGIEIPGMSHPRLQFTGGGERTLSFSVFLHSGATDDVPTTIKLLQSWQYAEYSNGKFVEAPPKLLIIFGDTWPDEQWLLRSCTVTHNRFDKKLNSIFAEVALEFVQYIDESVSREDIRS